MVRLIVILGLAVVVAVLLGWQPELVEWFRVTHLIDSARDIVTTWATETTKEHTRYGNVQAST